MPDRRLRRRPRHHESLERLRGGLFPGRTPPYNALQAATTVRDGTRISDELIMGAKRDLEDNSVQQRVKAWFEWMDACEQFLLAGMQRDVGPGGDIRSAYRQWHEKQMEEFGSWLGSDSSLRGRPVCVV